MLPPPQVQPEVEKVTQSKSSKAHRKEVAREPTPNLSANDEMEIDDETAAEGNKSEAPSQDSGSDTELEDFEYMPVERAPPPPSTFNMFNPSQAQSVNFYDHLSPLRLGTGHLKEGLEEILRRRSKHVFATVPGPMVIEDNQKALPFNKDIISQVVSDLLRKKVKRVIDLPSVNWVALEFASSKDVAELVRIKYAANLRRKTFVIFREVIPTYGEEIAVEFVGRPKPCKADDTTGMAFATEAFKRANSQVARFFGGKVI